MRLLRLSSSMYEQDVGQIGGNIDMLDYSSFDMELETPWTHGTHRVLFKDWKYDFRLNCLIYVPKTEFAVDSYVPVPIRVAFGRASPSYCCSWRCQFCIISIAAMAGSTLPQKQLIFSHQQHAVGTVHCTVRSVKKKW